MQLLQRRHDFQHNGEHYIYVVQDAIFYSFVTFVLSALWRVL